MATTTARNKNDADNMSTKERIWDSLNYSYGKKREESDKSFAKAYSQAVNQGLKTGMQRSSYGAQTLANIDNEKIKAQNDIYDQQIADYENRLYQIERDEAEDAWKQKQFEETQRQYNESLAFNKEQFGETKAQNAWNRTFQQTQADRSQANWEKEFGETQTQNAWNRTFQQTQADRTQSNWEKEFAETQLMNQFNRDYMQDEFKYKYGLAGAGGYGGSSSSGGGGNGGYTPTGNNNGNNGGQGLNWIDEAKLTTTNSKNSYLNTANKAAEALKTAFNTVNYLQQPYTNAKKAEAQAAQDKKNTVTYQINNKKQSTSKNVINTKK